LTGEGYRAEVPPAVAVGAPSSNGDDGVGGQASDLSAFRPASPGALALDDLREGLVQWRLSGALGWLDIRQRYRRSILGPLWLTFSMAVMVGSLGILYGALFQLPFDDFLPFLALGFLAWGIISMTVNDGCVVFTSSDSFIKQIKLPLSLYVYQMVWRNLIIFAHNIIVYVVVALYFQIWPGATALLALPGLVLILLNAVWVGIFFGMLCARFRDVPQIVASLMQVAFFLTPIIWKPELLGERVAFAQTNPFFHFVELLRAPLLGHAPSALSWAVVVAITIGGWALMFLFFRRFRARVAYWV
jgi:ABC-type polysaccharide/polyol phosphate export permease